MSTELYRVWILMLADGRDRIDALRAGADQLTPSRLKHSASVATRVGLGRREVQVIEITQATARHVWDDLLAQGGAVESLGLMAGAF